MNILVIKPGLEDPTAQELKSSIKQEAGRANRDHLDLTHRLRKREQEGNKALEKKVGPWGYVNKETC